MNIDLQLRHTLVIVQALPVIGACQYSTEIGRIMLFVAIYMSQSKHINTLISLITNLDTNSERKQ